MRRFLSIAFVMSVLPAAALAQPMPDPAAPPADPLPPPTEAPAPAAPVPVQAAPEPPKPPKPSDAKPGIAGFDKGFFIKTDDGSYSLKITGRVQPFYTLTRTNEPKDYQNAFEIRRARLVLEGTIHSPKLLYKMQSDFGKGFVTLKDFHADVEISKGIWVRGGQWKRPFSRQQITSSGRLEVTDRAITDRAFGAGRDIGVAIRNDYEKSPELEWIVGVFNGTGDAAKITSTTMNDAMGNPVTTTGLPTNVPKKNRPAVIARVGINRNGLKGYTEADLEGGPVRFGGAASVWLEGDFDDDKKSNQKLELDYVIKAEGLSTTGSLYMQTDQDGDSVTDAKKSLIGFHLQAGYMVVPKHWQIVGRYALVNDWATKDTSAKDQQEISVGGNYFALGHDAKLAAALRLIKTGDASFKDVVLFELGANVGF